MGELLKFKITHHSLNLYGECNGACDRKAMQHQAHTANGVH
jgi:Fur family ferric uptake transcriptional regulator